MSLEDLRAITAAWIRRALEEQRITPEDLAEKAKLSKSTVYRLLGEEVNVEETTIAGLAKVITRPFPRLRAADESPIKSDRKVAGSVQEPRSSYRAPSGAGQEDAAYLEFALTMHRQLAAAEREGHPRKALLSLVDLAEKVAGPIHGTRAKRLLDEHRARIQRGEKLDDGGGS